MCGSASIIDIYFELLHWEKNESSDINTLAYDNEAYL